LKHTITIGAITASGISVLYVINDNFNIVKKVQNSYTTDFKEPSQKWDSNWDFRSPTALVKPLKEDASDKREKRHASKVESAQSKATRHIIMIRHGQYDLKGISDKERILTKLGRQQARMTGKRLRELQIPFTDVVISTMSRAKETGNIILEELDNIVKDCPIEYDSLIEEGAPIVPEPRVGSWRAARNVN
jgi:serine/threonine-protein phosphatase PGAM5